MKIERLCPEVYKLLLSGQLLLYDAECVIKMPKELQLAFARKLMRNFNLTMLPEDNPKSRINILR